MSMTTDAGGDGILGVRAAAKVLKINPSTVSRYLQDYPSLNLGNDTRPKVDVAALRRHRAENVDPARRGSHAGRCSAKVRVISRALRQAQAPERLAQAQAPSRALVLLHLGKQLPGLTLHALARAAVTMAKADLWRARLAMKTLRLDQHRAIAEAAEETEEA